MQTTQATETTRSLYHRLGRAEGIRAIVEDVIQAHLENPTVKARFLPYLEDPERLAEIKEHTVQFFGMGTGGPEQYEGRSMPEAHRGMNLSEAEFVAVLDDIIGVLRARAVDEETQKDVLAILYSLKDDIVHL